MISVFESDNVLFAKNLPQDVESKRNKLQFTQTLSLKIFDGRRYLRDSSSNMVRKWNKITFTGCL